MIEAVLFDFGGVILSSPFEAFSKYEAEIGRARRASPRLNATNPDTNAWARLERSEVSLDEFCALYEAEAAAAGHAIDARRVLEALAGELRPEMVEAVRRCSARLKTACLTNNFVTTPGHVDREPQMAEVMALFHVVVESSKVGVRKPDPRFYEMACELLDVEPDGVRVPRRPRHQPQAGAGDGHDDDQGAGPAAGPRRPRGGRRLPARLTVRPTGPAKASSSRSVSSWAWMTPEPVAGLPDSTRQTWRTL